MTHFFEKTITDAKEIYLNCLLTTLIPLIHERFTHMYEKALLLEDKFITAEKQHPTVKNPGILPLFQNIIRDINTLNHKLIEDEYIRIKSNSRCADIFDDLVKAVLKSYIITLTYTASGKKCKIIDERMHERVEIQNFIHKCYIESSVMIHDNPALFWQGYDNDVIKNNQYSIRQIIRNGIKNAIVQSIPMKDILETYLDNDYVEEEENEAETYMKARDMIARDANRDEGGILRILETSESESEQEINMEDEFLKMKSGGGDDITSLIFNRNIHDTLDGITVSENKKQSEDKQQSEEKQQSGEKQSEEKQQSEEKNAYNIMEKKSNSRSSKNNVLLEAVEAYNNKKKEEEIKSEIKKNTENDEDEITVIGRVKNTNININSNDNNEDNFFDEN